MYAFLLSRHGKFRNGYTYTDTGLNLSNIPNMMTSPYCKVTIIGMVWKDTGWYLCEVERYGQKHYVAILNETGAAK